MKELQLKEAKRKRKVEEAWIDSIIVGLDPT